jgi:DNA repair exonuclease SbcCD ATPase subunit
LSARFFILKYGVCAYALRARAFFIYSALQRHHCAENAPMQTLDHDDDTTTDSATSLDTVRALWLQEHRGKPVSPLSERDVFAIATLLIKHHLMPTVDAIRRVNDQRGSPNVIHPSLRAYYECGEAERVLSRGTPPPNVPERVIELWDELKALVRAEDGAAHRARQQQLAESRASLDAQWRALEEQNAAVTIKLDAAAQTEADLRGQLAAMTAVEKSSRLSADQTRALLNTQLELVAKRDEQLVAARSELSTAQRDIALAQQRAADTEQAHQAALAHAHGLQRAAIDASATLETQLKALQGQLAQSQTALQDATARGDRLAMERAGVAIELATLQEHAASAEQRRAELANTHETTCVRLEKAEQELDQLRAQAQRMSLDLTNLRHQAASFAADRKVFDEVGKELSLTREKLEKVGRERDNLLRNPPALVEQLRRLEETLAKLVAARG